jgi:hypothetical protein
MNFNMYQDQGLFTIPQMTAAINRIPYAPRLIQALGIFQDVPVNSINPIIERRFGTRQVLSAVPFGVRNNVYDTPKRKGGVMRTMSINTSTMVTKQDAIGVRRFGTMETESVASIIADRLEWMRQDSIESTIESWRMQALLGSIMNPDGSVLANWYNFFEATPVTMPFSAAAVSTGAGVRGYCKSVKDAINDALMGTASTGFVGILGDNAWNVLFGIDEIKRAYEYRSVGDQSTSVAFMTETPGTPNPNQTSINWNALANVFTYGGITFLNYRSSVDFPTNKAVFFPMGVRDMFQSVLSPSSLIEEDGEMGTPFYARTWAREDGSGIDIYVESNRIEVNALPEACIQATFAA